MQIFAAMLFPSSKPSLLTGSSRQDAAQEGRLGSIMWAASSARIVRLVLAPALGLWVAGAGCMFGCERMVAAAQNPHSSATTHSRHKPTIVASGHACSSSKSHDCCKKLSVAENSTPSRGTGRADTLITSYRSSSEWTRCPLAVSRALIVAKAQGGEMSAAPMVESSSLPSDDLRVQTAPLSPPLRLPNRGHTYLRCCAFLI